MILDKLVISGFKSIATESPQTIKFDKNITAFVGHNGTGKSTVLEALNKLFSIDIGLRKINPSDFYTKFVEDRFHNKNIIIDAFFIIKLTDDNPSIPVLINGLVTGVNSKEVMFRVRLEASISYEYNPVGDIEENIWVIDGDMSTPEDDDKTPLTAAVRNSIQVTYIPANRDPLLQLKYSSRAILGRLLKAISWSEGEQEKFESKAQKLNDLTSGNPALVQISEAINRNWSKIYKGRYLSEAGLYFPLSDIDEILKLIQLQFMPDEAGRKVETSSLSDGQKSLVYFSLTKALFDIDKETRQSIMNKAETNFDPGKIRIPIFSLISLEEPENHLSPHYLGRIINLIKEYGGNDYCQAVVSTHSSSLISRIEPLQIRHFRLCAETESSHISSLELPSDEDEQAKYISEAVKAFPEIYFSKLVVLGEGDSEKVLLPKILSKYNANIDEYSISIVPLGGKHVNHFWRLLDSIKIPYVTLLDLDVDRSGGGFGRLKYIINQLNKYGAKKSKYLYQEIADHMPEWNSDQNPLEYKLSYSDFNGDVVNIVNELENCNVFFSSPIDLDYSMISSFPDFYCEVDTSYGERGPVNVEGDKKVEELETAVLKQGNSGIRFDFGEEYLNKFKWYRYRFLSNKSKPASHVRIFSRIEDDLTDQEIIERLPPEVHRLAAVIIALTNEVIE